MTVFLLELLAVRSSTSPRLGQFQWFVLFFEDLDVYWLVWLRGPILAFFLLGSHVGPSAFDLDWLYLFGDSLVLYLFLVLLHFGLLIQLRVLARCLSKNVGRSLARLSLKQLIPVYF